MIKLAKKLVMNLKHPNVLSLFDGISCGRIALERLGITPANYFASEIDKFAIKCTQTNYPDTIQLGDVRGVGKALLEPYDIDILFAGSPCQGFSHAGKQLNFEDDRSKLFFEFIRILKEVKPSYFLLENVRMKKEWQDVISSYVGVEPVLINSSLVSAQHRQRLYWTNIPNIKQPEDRGLVLVDILEDREITSISESYLQYALTAKFKYDRPICLPLKARCLISSNQKLYKFPNGIYRKLTPLECERLQTIPDGYTAMLSNTQRYKTLGNGWTVGVRLSDDYGVSITREKSKGCLSPLIFLRLKYLSLINFH